MVNKMDKCLNLLRLAAFAYQEKQYDNAATFFAQALDGDGLNSFVSFIDRVAPATKLNVPGTSDNLAPSLSSDIAAIADIVEKEFRAEASYLDDGDELVEVAAATGDEEPDDSDDDFVVVATCGPVAIKS